MAIQGLSYAKTSWAFEERPVSSAKLNQWDDRIEASLELAFRLLNQAWGGGEGILRGIAAGELTVTPTTPIGMRVAIEPGYAFIAGYPFRLTSQTETPELDPPLTNNRIDLVQADLATWTITIKQGAESPSPTAPTADTAALALAQLMLRPGMTSIKATDDTINGYIIDTRSFL